MISDAERERCADLCAEIVRGKIDLKRADARADKRRAEARATQPDVEYEDHEGNLERQKLRKAVQDAQRTLDEMVLQAVSERLQTE